MAMYEMDSFDQEKKNQRKEVASSITQYQNPNVGQQQTNYGLLQNNLKMNNAPQQQTGLSNIRFGAKNESENGQKDYSNIQPSAAMAGAAAGVTGADANWRGATDRLARGSEPLSYQDARLVLLEHALTSPDAKYAYTSIIKHLSSHRDPQKVLDLANQIVGGYRGNELKKEMQGEAKSFREKMPEMQAEQTSDLTRSYQRSLDTGIKQIRKGMSSRGLLYSGMRQGQEAGLRGQVAADMARSQVEINAEMEQLARAKEMAAAKYGIKGYQEAMDKFEALYGQQMKNAIERRRRAADIGSAVGYAAGTMYSNYKDKPEVIQTDGGRDMAWLQGENFDYENLA